MNIQEIAQTLKPLEGTQEFFLRRMKAWKDAQPHSMNWHTFKHLLSEALAKLP